MAATTLTTSLSLLEDLRNGADERAWQEFFRRYAPLLVATARRLGLSESDADDVVQETIVAVHQAFRTKDEPFDHTRSRFKTWLQGITLHKIMAVRRRHARAQRDLERAREWPPSEVDDAQAVFDQEWERNQLAIALREVARCVDPGVYQAFELYAVLGQPASRVAKFLGVSRNAVYISKSRVLARLRDVLARLERDEVGAIP